MAQINKPTDYFNTKLYTGNGSTNAITGVGFQPDWVWVKARSGTHGTQNHRLFDAIRGATKELYSDLTDAEATVATGLTSLDSDGFSLSTSAGVNGSSTEYASWNWLGANGTASNTDGSITSTVSANTTSGFSIVSYTGNGTSGATIGHSLTTEPACVIIKRRNSADAFNMYHQSLGATKYLKLDRTDAATTSSLYYNDTAPTSSVFSVGNETGVNNSSDTYIAYCFSEVKGFSKFGKFTSNGSDDGTFTYCGFKPAWIMMKPNVSDTWSDWYIFDSKRDPHNLTDLDLKANESAVENNDGSNYAQIDMLSNGFKIRRDGNWGLGGNGTEVIYMAFASEPLVGSNNVPATAR